MNKKGFTIIELIVVIAIIAVLAAIVMVNVTQYIAKGKVAAVKANMANVIVDQADYFNSMSTYRASLPTSFSSAISSSGGTVSQYGVSGSTGWCLKVTLPDSTTWCVDSAGYKGSTATSCSTGTSTSCGG